MPLPEIEPEQAAVGSAGLALVGKWLLDQLGGSWWKNRAAARKLEAEADKTVAQGWREMAQELRAEIEAERERCDERLAALEGEMDIMRQIIAALVTRRAMDQRAKALLLKIAPTANTQFEEKPA